VLLAFLAFSIAEHATWLAVLFYALQRGGPKEVGLVAVLQLAPAVAATPFSSYAGDRFDPQRALAVGYAVQSITMAGTAVAMWQGASIAAYLLAAVGVTAVCFTRPVMGSLLPTLTHAPADLVAANVVVGIIEQIGVFIGPLTAGALIAATSPAAVFASAAGLTAIGSILTIAVRREPEVRPAEPLRFRAAVGELFGGFSALRRTPVIGVFLMLLACGGLIKGVGDVIFVTYADIRLDGTAGQTGILAGAYGFGGLIGATSATALIRGRRVDRQLAAVALALGAGLFGLAAASTMLAATVGFALLGGAESALVLTSIVSVQRVAPTDVLARVFGIVEAAQTACIALGSIVITVLVASLSLGTALIILGVFLVLAIVVGVARVRRQQDMVAPVDPAVVDRVLADPLFDSLPAPIVERLARNMRRFAVPTGSAVVLEGATGDRFYLVVSGVLDVTRGGQVINRLDQSHSFGELALLRDVPRAATVTATTDVELLALDREPFLEAVTGHSRSLAVANQLLDSFG
jgi:predicted MFS family arabinose efflux permease